MAERPDVLIVGGGVIGLTAAHYLALENISATVIERGDFGQEASWAGAGILPPASSKPVEDPFEQLHQLSLREFPNLSADLFRQTGIDNGYRVCGGLEFLAGRSSGHEGEWSGAGVQPEALDESAARTREPALGSGLGGVLFLPGLAQVRNPWHIRALVASCKQLGVGLRSKCEFLDAKLSGDRIVAACTAQGEISCGRVLFTSGPWTAGLLRQLGYSLPVRPVRGQIALVNTEKSLLRHVLMWGARYIVPREDGRVLVGSTEEEAGFDKSTTREAISSLLEFAHRLVPALARFPVEKTWAGLRPATPDDRPCIGQLPNWGNAFVAAGHFRSGIQLSPGTGLICKDLLLDRKPAIPLESLRPDRFAQEKGPAYFPA